MFMIKILFICHGNICRSPMAHFILQDYINKNNLEDVISVDSMACSSEEIGNSIYPPARRTLQSHNIPIIKHYANKFKESDYDKYNYIILMDNSNLRRMNNIKPDNENKYRLLMSYAGLNKEVSDPWYTGDFETCYNDIIKGINGLLNELNLSEVL